MIGARRIERRNSPPHPSQWSRRLDGIRIGGGMAEQHTLTAYTDYKSPYAYLAKDLVYELQRDFPVRIDWLPYRLDIPSFLGSARLDDSGRVIEEQRNAHQWRRVRYSYMDCRRHRRVRGADLRTCRRNILGPRAPA